MSRLLHQLPLLSPRVLLDLFSGNARPSDAPMSTLHLDPNLDHAPGATAQPPAARPGAFEAAQAAQAVELALTAVDAEALRLLDLPHPGLEPVRRGPAAFIVAADAPDRIRHYLLVQAMDTEGEVHAGLHRISADDADARRRRGALGEPLFPFRFEAEDFLGQHRALLTPLAGDRFTLRPVVDGPALASEAALPAGVEAVVTARSAEAEPARLRCHTFVVKRPAAARPANAHRRSA